MDAVRFWGMFAAWLTAMTGWWLTRKSADYWRGRWIDGNRQYWNLINKHITVKKELAAVSRIAEEAMHENDLARKHVIGTIADEAVTRVRELNRQAS